MRVFVPLATVWLMLIGSMNLACARWDDKIRVTGSGNAATEQRQVEEFDQLQIEGAVDAKVTIADEQSVTIEADDNIVPLIETRVEGGRLVISSRGTYSTRIGVRAIVTVPRLKGVSINGSGDAEVSGLAGESFAAAINGSGDVTARGEVESVNAAIRGSGNVNLAQLTARRGRVAVAGSGDVTINASEVLDVSIAGSGDVKYLGSPKLTKSVAGSGDVKKSG